jgi:Mce-associated membrane protein
MLRLSRNPGRANPEPDAADLGGAVAVADDDTGDHHAAEPEQADAGTDTTSSDQPSESADRSGNQRRPVPRISVRHLVFGVLPIVALSLALTAGWFKWQVGTAHDADLTRIESVQAATEGTVALLSYKPDTVEKDLDAAKDRLTGPFRDSYSSLTHDVVIPGAKQKQVSAVATVPAAAAISSSATHAVVLLFVNQTMIMGNDAPTDTASSVRVTLDKVGQRWLISGFDPV